MPAKILMVREVQARVQRLQQQVQELRIEIARAAKSARWPR
jgi:hypothetical protein